jgi:putative Mg2+ transporter-C (MgtC) family protein
MNIHADPEIFLQLLISFGIGTAIGVEREYRSKAAGLRTMIMICLGSTIFTQISIGLGGVDNADRIASAIVTGIGFLGAGVIFKDGLNVSGLTTATTIWISAALGMAVGAGEYFVALIGSAVVLVVLIGFEKVKELIESFHQSRTYKISFEGNDEIEKEVIEELNRLRLHFLRRKNLKTKKYSVIVYDVIGQEARLDQFNEFLKMKDPIRSYEY